MLPVYDIHRDATQITVKREASACLQHALLERYYDLGVTHPHHQVAFSYTRQLLLHHLTSSSEDRFSGLIAIEVDREIGEVLLYLATLKRGSCWEFW